MARLEDQSIEDQQTIADFAAFLGGASACVMCLMPTTECKVLLGEPCCDDCLHRQLKPKEEPQ